MEESFTYFGTLVIPQNYSCNVIKSNLIFTAGTVIYLLLLPMFVFVFWVGYKKQKNTSSSSSAGSISHFDTLTYHMTAIDTIGSLGSCLSVYALYANDAAVEKLGSCILHSIVIGQVLFHCLTCVERYLAVVQPITYLSLKQRGGVTIRNIILAVTWLGIVIGAAVIGFTSLSDAILIFAFVLSFHALAITTFCSVSVLCVLVRPAPGDRGGDRKRVNQSKLTAFYTIMIIQGALLLKFMTLVLYYAMTLSESQIIDECVLVSVVFLFELPSCAVLPLLFLHKERKLPCCNWKK